MSTGTTAPGGTSHTRDGLPPGSAPGGSALSPDRLGETLLDAWERLDAALVVVDEDLRVLAANAAWRAQIAQHLTPDGRARPLTGDESTADGRPLLEDRQPMRRALAGEEVIDEEVVLPAGADGPARRYVVSTFPMEDRDGRRRALASWRDVTSRWQLDVERRHAFDQVSRMIDGAADHAIFLLDREGRVLTWSVCAEQVKRYSEQQVLGHHYSIFFTEQDRAEGVPDRILRECVESGRSVIEGLRVRGDGSLFRARGVITAQYDDEGRLSGFVKVSQDVTEEYENRARIEQLSGQLAAANEALEHRIADRTRELERQTRELLSVNAELEAFSSSVSHDLRAPLRAVGGFADLLQDDHADALDERGRHYLARIRAAADEMGTLIEALLRLARVQRQDLDVNILDMTAQVRQAWSVLPHGTRARLDLEPLPEAVGDADLVRQVWANLLDNAVKFSAGAEQPEVVVRGWTEDGTAVYQVRDNGAGFDGRGAHRLFQPFSRLHHVDEFPGTGVGLALVQRIVHRHGGRIEATSVAGHGATFTFTLGAP